MTYEKIMEALKLFYEVETDEAIYEIIWQNHDPINEIAMALQNLKGE